jgi:hypothetical protein
LFFAGFEQGAPDAFAPVPGQHPDGGNPAYAFVRAAFPGDKAYHVVVFGGFQAHNVWKTQHSD